MSRFGSWVEEDGLPVFAYTADPATTPAALWDPVIAPPTHRHWAVIGNRRLCLIVDNLGTVAVLDEFDGLRYVTAPDPAGTGESLIDGRPGVVTCRRFGPTWFAVDVAFAADGLELTRTFVLPENDVAFLLVRVGLRNSGAQIRRFVHTEQWVLRPRALTLGVDVDLARANAEAAVIFDIEAAGGRVVAREIRTARGEELVVRHRPHWFGQPHVVVLEAFGAAPGLARGSGVPHPTLEVTTPVSVEAGGETELWFRFGLDGGDVVDDPVRWAETARTSLAARLPSASARVAPAAAREVPWHAALLSGGACADGVLGGHTLDQSSAYSHLMGFNGAARDPLQHAMPLVYSEPDLALSVLRNTCAWASPDGDLPYALDGAKRPWRSRWQPSDQNLWALWLAAEYTAATGDLAAFAAPVGFHPRYEAEPVALSEHLRRQFEFLVEGVGLGEHGHLRIRNADWNDVAISTSGVPHEEMVEKGESVLNSAMAAWVLPVYAGLCERLGDAQTATWARAFGEDLRQAVAGEWNGRWFRRAYGPGRSAIGDDDFWLEGQPWAILCGAASPDQAAQLLSYLDEGPRRDSPLGTRVRWPVTAEDGLGGPGEATNGGIWYSINATVVWAAARHDPDLAWDEWRRMTLAAHTDAYPDVWEGTITGPDTYNSPESTRAGRTWALPDHEAGMQPFPVGNLHSHAQPLLAYLRLLGVEPTADGSLRVAGADEGAEAAFSSLTFSVAADGSGRLEALGPVSIESKRGRIEGGPGEVVW